ncbi:MAG: hypothetical protein IT303_10440 [Dehalococcoidia bacterium]|nr:hypothetical protein [Dehalococcoidia bacterium]
MGIGISLVLIAAGAILTYAVETTVEGLNIDAVGVILMAVGFVGLLFSLLFLMTWSPFAFGNRSERYERVDRVDRTDHTHDHV